MTKQKLISVKLDEEQYRHLIRTVHLISVQKDADLCLSDLVREALDQAYPMNKADYVLEGEITLP